MKTRMNRQNAVSFVVGFLFAVGLAVAGMTQPQKVIGFLSFSGWDPSLIFVMLGAVGVHVVAYPLIKRKSSPLLDTKWHVPNRKDLTARLIIGSALFGIGWGLGGFCPGPGITSLASGDSRAVLFVVTMIIGMLIFKSTERFLKLRE
jgi:uncharacterized protein